MNLTKQREIKHCLAAYGIYNSQHKEAPMDVPTYERLNKLKTSQICEITDWLLGGWRHSKFPIVL